MASPIAPVISATGISAYAYSDILAWLQSQYQSIYGADVYLGNDSQDGQFLAILAQAFADCNAATVAVYNSFSPSTAQGNGLSSVIKINGIKRAIASSSTVDVTIVGVAGTVITNGQATDTNGKNWALPASVTIPTSGTITVTATCTEEGSVSAAVGSVTNIKTPVYGWQSVTNSSVAATGNPVESDAALRIRQSQSVAAPSITIFEGVMASVSGLTGVTRSRGYENNTSSTDANGITANSVAIIVEGGDSTTIAQTIAKKMTPGTPTVGSVSNTIVDASGSSRLIKFARPTQAVIHVALTVKALSGWSTSIESIIAQSIADYLNALAIGQSVIYTRLFVPASIVDSDYASTFNITAMTIAKGAGTPGTADLTLAYNEAATGATANVTFTVV